MRTYLLIHSWAVSSPLHCRPAARPRAERVENNPDMHAALARLVNNEETRKQEKINHGIVVTIAIVVAAVAREAPRLGRAQVGGVGARRDESNEERVLS